MKKQNYGGAPQVSAAGLVVWVSDCHFTIQLGEEDEVAAGGLCHLALQAGHSIATPLFVFEQEGCSQKCVSEEHL
jgi:hypothetical protein